MPLLLRNWLRSTAPFAGYHRQEGCLCSSASQGGGQCPAAEDKGYMHRHIPSPTGTRGKSGNKGSIRGRCTCVSSAANRHHKSYGCETRTGRGKTTPAHFWSNPSSTCLGWWLAAQVLKRPSQASPCQQPHRWKPECGRHLQHSNHQQTQLQRTEGATAEEAANTGSIMRHVGLLLHRGLQME